MRQIQPFLRVAGTLRPLVTAHVQTDGSYHQRYRVSRTAVILRADEEHHLLKSYIDGEHKNSTESEWASVLDGIKFSIAKDQGAVELENDNLGVIRAIAAHQAKNDMDRYYLHSIRAESEKLDWLAVRWIPREQNRADMLFGSR